MSLGMGGMGGVNLAVSMGPAGFTKLLVVKRLLPEIVDNPEFLSMFLQEAKLSARLNHPNIVQTYEIGSDAASHFLTMEYLEGQSLHSILRAARLGPPPALDPNAGPLSDSGPLSGKLTNTLSGKVTTTLTGETSWPPSRPNGGLPLPFFLRALAEALEGLHYAHELADHDGSPLHMVHRDVSPGNIFVTYEGTVKLLDFGIAKAADSSLHTRTGMLKGKVAYMAPEQLRQSRELDRRADLFAVGTMLWQAATGQRLWRGLSDLEVLMRLSKGQLPRPSEIVPEVHPRLEQICCKAMAFERDARHATAAELRDDVETLLDELGPVSSREFGAYVTGLFGNQRGATRAFVRRKVNELRVAHGLEESPLSMRALPVDSSREDSRLGPLPITISRPVWREQQPSPGRRFAWLGLAMVGSVAVASATLWARADRTTTLSTSNAMPTASPAAVPTVAPQTRVVVAASPADARIFVDGVPIMVNPYSAAVPVDARKHDVRAEAPGFLPQTKSLEFGPQGASVYFALERDGAKARPTPGPAHPARGAAAPEARPPAPAPPPEPSQRKGPGNPAIDRGSPWLAPGAGAPRDRSSP